MLNRNRDIAAAAVLAFSILAAGLAGAQSNRVPASKDPTAGISSPARGIKDLNMPRTGAQDSTLVGGISSVLPDNRVTLPSLCEIDPAAQGCPGFCDANPTSPLCAPDGVVTPPVIPDPGPPGQMFACMCPGMAYHPGGGFLRAYDSMNFATISECESYLANIAQAANHYCDSTVPFHMGPNAVCYSIIRRGLLPPLQEHCEMV